MTLRERAAADAKEILESDGCASAIAIIQYEKESVTVKGSISDTERLLEKSEGHIQVREIYFSCIASSLPELPVKGIKVNVTELTGKSATLYVSRVEHDRVLGLYVLVLSPEPEPEHRD